MATPPITSPNANVDFSPPSHLAPTGLDGKWTNYIQHAANLILILERSGKIKSFKQVHAPTRETDLIGRTIYDLIRPEFHGVVRNTLCQVCDTNLPASCEIAGLDPGGAERWYSIQIDPILDSGVIQAVKLAANDITSHKQTESELWKTQAYYRTMVEDMPALMCRFLPDGVLTFVNEHYCRYFNLEREQLVGQNFFQFIPSEDRESVRQHFASLSLQNPATTYEHKVIAPDKSMRWQRWTDRAIFDDLGFPVEYQSIGEDITESKLTEQALHASEEKYRKIAEISNLFVGAMDIDVAIQASLASIGQTVGARRVSIFQVRNENGQKKSTMIDNTHEWCAPGVLPAIHQLKDLDTEKYTWILSQLDWSQPHFLEDCSKLPNQAGTEKEMALQLNVTSCLFVPMVLAGELSGVLTLADIDPIWLKQVQDFSLFRVIGEIIANALERQRAQEAERRARQQSESLRRVMAALTSELDLEQVLNSILDYLEKVIPFNLAVVLLQDGKAYHLKTCKGLQFPDQQSNFSFLTEKTLLKEIYSSGQTLILADAQQDERFRSLSAHESIHGWLGVPLRLRGKLMGYLIICSEIPGAYGQAEAALVQTFADQSAIAIDNARLYQQAQQLSVTDPLTGLNNRRRFFELARKEFQRSQRYRRDLSILMIDIDHFKQVNDLHGHLAGDRVLQSLARDLVQNLRGNDLLGRYGGDEFVVLMPETDLRQACQVAERICQSISGTPLKITAGEVCISASLGVAALDVECKGLDTLLVRADRALYAAKETGRNQVCAWHA